MADKLIPPSPSEEAYAVDEDQGDVFTIGDPFALFADWLALARKTEPNDANAMALATADESGLPNVRMVLLKDVGACGLTFFTNTLSAKGEELRDNPQAAVVFHWKSIRRQVRFRGDVAAVSAQEADEYFATRARGAQLGAWGSDQSRPLDRRQSLETRIARLEKDYKDREPPRPPHWSGYRLIPAEIEFWVNRPYRLHDRLQFTRENDKAPWKKQMLYP